MLKILVIDDNSDNLISLKAIIDDAFPGSAVFTALNGPKGIELAIANNPDVILLDIIMPGMDGFEVCRLLKLDEPVSDIPVVFLTALKGDKENRIRALEVGAEGFLSKPIDETELTVQIRAMVKIKAANEQKRDEKERLEKLVEERTKELIQSQAQLKGIFENLQDAYFQTDLSGCFTIVSPSSVKMYGYQSADELIGLPADKLYFDLNERSSMLSVLRSAGSIKDHVLQGRKKDDSAFWVSMNVQLLKGGDGQILGTEGVVRDISERKKAERALKESEERFQILFNKAPLGYQSLDFDGHFIEVNQQWLDTLGYTREEVIGKWFGDFLSPDYKEGFRKRFPLFKAQGHIHSEFEMVHRNGDKLFIAFDGRIGYDLNGEFKQTHCILQDVTEKRKAEKALLESEEKYRIMVELLPDAVIIHEGGKLVFANAAAIKTVGADTFEQLTERSLFDFVHPDYRTFSLNRIKEIYSTGRPSKFSEEKFLTLKGEIIDVEVLGLPIFYMGKPAIQTIIRDITERKTAEEVLFKYNSRLELAMKAANMSWWEMDMTNGHVIFERRKAEMLGYAPEKFKHYTDFMNLVHPEDHERTMDAMRSHLDGSLDKYEVEYRIKTISGEYKWFYDIGSVTKRDAEGRPLIVSGLVLDISERKLAEEMLRESEYFFRESQRAAFVGSYKFELRNDFWSSSEVMDQIFGIEESYTHSFEGWLDIVHPDDREMMQQYFLNEVVGQHKSFNKEYRIIRKSDGETRWVLGLGKLGFDEQDNVVSMIGTIQDITIRKLAEEAQNESYEFNQYLLKTIPFGMDIVDEYGNILFQNQNLENVFGNNVIGAKCWELYRDDKSQCSECPLRKGIEVGKTDAYESSGVLGGRVFEINHTGMMFKGKKAMLEIFQDITERKKSEQKLQEREQLFRGLFNASPDAIVLIDPHHPTILWPIVDCNEASCRMNGYLREEMIGKSIDLLNITPETLEDRITYYSELKQNGIIHMETSHRHKDGHIFPIEISTSIVVIGGHEMVLGIDRDITERKQAETALRKSEDRYRQFISQVSEGVYRFECDQPIDIGLPLEEQVDLIYDHMFIAECNDAFLKIYGIKDRNEAIGKGHLYFHDGRYHPVNRGALVAFIKNGYHVENAMTEEVNHQGKMTYISHNSMGIIENDQLVRIWGTQIDITQKIHADRVQQVLFTISNATLTSNDLTELIEIISNELGNLLDSTNFFIAFYDESTEMLSTLYEKGDKDNISNWPAEKSLTGYIIKHQKSLLATESDILKLCETGEIEIVGIPSKIWMGVPLAVNKKVIGAIVVQSYDNPDAFTEKEKMMLEFVSHQVSISIERKKAEQDLKLMGKAFDQSPVTIVITDPNGAIEYINPKFTETTGYTQDEVKGQNPRVLKSGYHSMEYYQNLWKTITSGNDWVGEFQNRRKNGETYWESAVISPITNENGKIDFFLAIKEDITEKKKMIDDLILARNKAEEGDRLKSAFLANMSHEIRTPLNSIIGFSELMADPDFDADQQTEFAKIIINSGNSLLSIISDIMDFSKIEAGQVIVRKSPFVVQNLIFSLQNEYSFTARGKGIELRIDPLNPKDDIWIRSDENRLKQVLVNLVGNAIKFTKEGYVEIGIKATGDCIQFQVRDTRIGIPKEYHDEIFERFRQVESSNSRKYGGNGLGLAISKSLVEMMGGEIWIESVQGKGSTFYFTIPIGLTTI